MHMARLMAALKCAGTIDGLSVKIGHDLLEPVYTLLARVDDVSEQINFM